MGVGLGNALYIDSTITIGLTKEFDTFNGTKIRDIVLPIQDMTPNVANINILILQI